MKKTLFFAAACALLMASCTNEETVKVAAPSNAIGFDTFVGKVTKGEAVTTANLQSFYVYGGYDANALVFNNQAVIFNDGSWSYSPLQYWEEGEDYYFAAVAPQVDNASYDLNTLSINGYSAGDDDLIVATTGKYTALAESNSSVQLSFKHALTQIKFTFKNNAQDVTNVRLSGVNSVADLAVSGSEVTWSNAGTPKQYAVDGSIFVLPQDVTANMVLSFSMGDKNYTINLNKAALTEWAMGSAYNYNVNLAENLEEIGFDVTVGEWQDGSGNLQQPEESEGPQMIEQTQKFECVADTWLSKTITAQGNVEKTESKGPKYANADDESNIQYGLYGFTYSLPAGAEVKDAKLHLVTERVKANIDLYGLDLDFNETELTWDEFESYTTSSKKIKEDFSPAGQRGKAIFDGLDAAYQNIDAWVNDIDVTEYVKELESVDRINFFYHSRADQVCFWAKDNTGRELTADKWGTDETISSDKLMPYLEVTFLVPQE